MAGTLEPRERGGPIQKFWEDPLVLSQLETIKTWLTKNVKKVRRPKITLKVTVKERHTFTKFLPFYVFGRVDFTKRRQVYSTGALIVKNAPVSWALHNATVPYCTGRYLGR